MLQNPRRRKGTAFRHLLLQQTGSQVYKGPESALRVKREKASGIWEGHQRYEIHKEEASSQEYGEKFS